MKLTDKRLWKFEVMMLLCGFLLFCALLFALWTTNSAVFDMGTGAILMLSFPVVLLYFASCGIPTWLLYKGNSWLKLAGWLYLISSLLVIVLLLIFFYDWNPITANMRPADISPDEGKYVTDNEFIAIVCAIWSVFLAIPVLITSFLTKRWIVTRVKATADKYSLESIGVSGFAYSKQKALEIAENCRNSNKAILGGDVYLLKKGHIESTSASWYCDRNDNETPADYVTRSYNVTIDYLNQYPDNTEFLFSFVTDER